MPRAPLSESKFTLALAFAATLVVPAVAMGDKWEKEKGDCDQTFEQARTESLDRLRDCTMRWAMFRDVTKVDDNTKTIVQEGMEKLYNEGSERDAVMALSALKSMGLRPARLREKTIAVPKADPPPETAPVVEAIPTAKPSKASRAAAEVPAAEPERAPNRRDSRAHISRGQAFLKGGMVMEGLTAFLEACDADPTYAPPLYLTAVAYARLGKHDMAIDYLKSLKALNSDEARPLIHRAPTDPSFKAMRGMGAFKDLTGTAVVQILNGAGDAGKGKVDSYAKRLQEIGQPVANIGVDRNPRHNTYIYSKPGFEGQGEDLRRQLKLGLVHSRPIHWPSEYDIVIVVGAPEQTKFVDDEAEKNGQKKADMNKAEEAAKKKAEANEQAEKDKLKKRMMMIKAMEEMESPTAPAAPSDATQVPMDAPEAPAVPE